MPAESQMKPTMTIQGVKSRRWRDRIVEMAQHTRQAADVLGQASTDAKNATLTRMARLLETRADEIVAANTRDIEIATKRGIESRLLERLRFDHDKVTARVNALRAIAHLPDPLAEEETVFTGDGLTVKKRRVPIGVIGMIYEARPHVTVNAGALCVKAGNAVLLKGGSEALRCNRLLGALWQEALEGAGLPASAIQVIASSDRRVVRRLLALDELVDLIIPRGGPQLIRAVAGGTRIPVIKHSQGICHVYVDAQADPGKACAIVLDSKTYAPSVCNATETVLVHRDIAPAFLPGLGEALRAAGVEVRGCERTWALLPWAVPATEGDWDTEHLDLVLGVRIVDTLDEALAHIARYGSRHTDAIVSEDSDCVERFVREVDSGVVLSNASTMFNDGSRLGMGAEIGISADKIHARGPMGLRELTCQKWVIEGDGHVFAQPARTAQC